MKQGEKRGFTAFGMRLGWRLAVVIGIVGLMPAALAAPIPFKQDMLSYQLDNEPLTAFLDRFFAEQGLQVVQSPLVISQSVSLNGPRTGTGGQVWRNIADANQLIGYYDGYVVYVYKRSESLTRYLSVPPARVREFARVFNEMRLGDGQNTFNVRADTGLITVGGTPRFVEQVQQLATTLSGQFAAGPMSFKIFPLKYAWASDTTLTVGNRIITIPGVSTTLRDLLYGPGNVRSGTQERIVRPAAVRLRGQGLAAQGGLPPLEPYAQPTSNGAFGTGGNVYGEEYEAEMVPVDSADPNAPRIVADPYRNAIIVRDRPDHMEVYDELVRALDVEPTLVEIEATIIDVNINKLRNLGIDWRWRNARNEVGFAGEGVRDNFIRALAGDSVDLIDSVPGLQISTIIGDSYRFIARINALAGKGATNIVSRPQVVTLNDVEAVIENSQSLYVPVAGAYEVDLFNIIAGTVLRVTPHVVHEHDRRRIRLLVTIEDGGIVPTTSRNQIQETFRSTVNTQAMIEDGQSLLLGGLIRDLSGKDVDKIPGLGDIPVVGALFRHESKRRERTERLFLITPRLVPANRITSQTQPSHPSADVDQISQEQDEHERQERRLWFKSRRTGTRP